MAKRSKDPVLLALGETLRERREAIGLSQEELGHLAGLHRTYVGSLERGERNATLKCIVRICAALQLSPHQLLERSGL